MWWYTIVAACFVHTAMGTVTMPVEASVPCYKPTSANCTLYAADPGPSLWVWKSYRGTKTVTAATIITIINTARNLTTKSTVFNPVSDMFRPPKTNEAGTKVETITYEIHSLGVPAVTTTTVL